jgi:arylsulfatase A-like enzyme
MPSEYHQTTWCTQQAIDFIGNAHHHGRSWLFSLNIFDPHHPFDPPVDYLERYLDKLDDIPLPDYVEGELESKPVFIRKDHNGAYDDPKNIAFSRIGEKEHKLLRAAYWAMVDLIDVQVGRLLDLLEATGQLENTLIIFMSDHGEMLGDHGMYLKGPHFYEQALHVPLIMAWPGTIDGGRRSEGLVELVDLAPTLLDAAGIAPEPGMQGKSFWPILQGKAPLDHHRDDVYCEYYNSNLNHRTPLAFATMVSDGRHKLVKVHGKPEEVLWTGELYDLENDPGEHINLWDDPRCTEVKMRMLEKLCDRMAETCDPLPLREAMF